MFTKARFSILFSKQVSAPSTSILAHATTWKTNESKGDFAANQLLLLEVSNTATPMDLVVFTDLCNIAPDGNFIQEVGQLATKDLKALLLTTIQTSGYIYQSHRDLLTGFERLNAAKPNYLSVLPLLLNLDKAAKTQAGITFTAADSLNATQFKEEIHAFIIDFGERNGKALAAPIVKSTFEKEFDGHQWKNLNPRADLSKIKYYALAIYTEMMPQLSLGQLSLEGDDTEA